MSYIGRGLEVGSMRQLDDISSSFDGSTTGFTMQINSVNVDQSVVGDVNQLVLSLGGVIQKPGTDFTVSGSTLTFTTAPAANTNFFCIIYGGGGGFATPGDLTVTAGKLATDIAITTTGAANFNGGITMGGTTPSLTIGDAGAEDTKIVFDGNAQDFHIGLDDSADDLVIGVGSALGTTTAISITDGRAVTVGESGVASTLAGIPFFSDSSNFSMYTHDVSGTDSTAAGNSAYGFKAMDAITTGDDNTAMGENALGAITTGSNNVGYGKNAIQKAASSGGNVAVGDSALKELTYDGNSYNVAIGHNAGLSLTNAAYNTLIGGFAGDGYDTENHNIGIGLHSLGGSVAGGEYNVGVGNYTLDALTSGDINTCVGNKAGSGVTTGTGNVLFGHQAGDYSTAVTTGNYNVCLGSYTRTSATGSANQIVIGEDIAGGEDNQITIGKASNIIQNEFDTDNAWTQSSDVRKKKNIKDAVLGLDFVNDLRPVTYEWKPNNEFPKDFAEYSEENHMTLDVTMHGMVAQEVKAALDKTGVDRFGGWQEDSDGCQRLSKEMFVFPLIKAVQELSAQVTTLQQEINTLKEGK